MSRLKIGFIQMLFLTVLCSYSDPNIVDCQTVFSEAVQLEQQSPNAAYNKYYYVCNHCGDDVTLTEKAHYNAAKLTQRYFSSQHYPDPCQLFGQGILSVDSWRSYIKWYSNLAQPDLRILSQQNLNRIQPALIAVGDVIRKRGLLPPGCDEEKVDYFELFEIYSLVNADRLTVKCIDLWLDLLMRCRSSNNWSDAITFDQWVTQSNPCQYCTAEWIDFHSKLGEWLGSPASAQLSPVARNVYRQKLTRIGQKLQST